MIFIARALIACLLMFFPISVAAQGASGSENGEHKIPGKHRIELNVGLLSEVSVSNEVSYGGVTTESDASGVIASIAYTYYLKPEVGIIVSAGLLDADATTSTTSSTAIVESASVTSLLFGVKYQPSRLTIGDALRPYASASIGPYFGSASNVRAGTTTSTQSFTETALGLRLAVGTDVFFGGYFSFGVGLGYNAVSDFDNRIGSEKNYSSPEFTLSFGVIFGDS